MRCFLSGYQPFVSHVRKLGASRGFEDWRKVALAALNGQAGQELERLISLKKRRELGAFFTNHEMADKLLKTVRFSNRSLIYDPACGAGDLLLAAARKLGRKKTIEATLTFWSQCLVGSDLVEQFLEAANARLFLQAKLLHPLRESTQALYTGRLHLMNAFNGSGFYKEATNVVMNPPFTLKDAPESCTWASGKVNAAALFVEQAATNLRQGAQIHAILPEVLRTGARYEKWRSKIASYASQIDVVSVGLFPGNADVDVFFFHFTRARRHPSATIWTSQKAGNIQRNVLGSKFKVSVGRVVPHRDAYTGPFCRYAHVRNVRAWETVKKLSGKRHWGGKMEKPPFVVIRRTSRPGDPFRATASIITGRTPVAVENHLIVCKPNTGGVKMCNKLVNALKRKEVNAFLNREMRCRHLTVGVVRKIPIPKVTFCPF